MEKAIKTTLEKALEIIDTREPKGLFYTEEDGVFVGIDNTTGDARTEDFDTVGECFIWLKGS